MTVRAVLGETAVAAATILSARLALRNYGRLPLLSASGGKNPEYGHVSIIIPARNEARRLPRLLSSLARLEYADAGIVVVDDGSTDRTAEVAEEYGATVVRIEGPPPGWTGKTFACQRGANSTSGQWLLFTDADTCHEPASLSAMLSVATGDGIDVLSLLAAQRCETFWEKLLIPYAYLLYFSGHAGINRNARSAVANGQYILCRRSTYDRLGGHAAVRGSITDDVSLARQAAASGARIILLRGEQFVAVRMYDGLASLWEGFSKNSYGFVRLSPGAGVITAMAGLAYLTAATHLVCRPPTPLRLAVLLTPIAALAPWYRRYQVSAQYACLYPVAAVIFQILALDSMRRAVVPKAITWKGRRY